MAFDGKYVTKLVIQFVLTYFSEGLIEEFRQCLRARCCMAWWQMCIMPASANVEDTQDINVHKYKHT